MVNISKDTIYDILYIVIPSLLIVFVFYLESKYVTEHEREKKEFFKIFFLSAFLLGIIQYGYRFYYDISTGSSGSSIKSSSKDISKKITSSIKDNVKKIKGGVLPNTSSIVKKNPDFDISSAKSTSIVKDTIKSIVDKVSDVSSNVGIKIAEAVPSPTSSPSSLVKSISIPINPNLPDF